MLRGAQYVDNVINNGTSDYAMAYFEFGAIRVFSDNSTAPTISSSSSASPSSTSKSGSGSSTASGPGATTTNTNTNTNQNQNGARALGASGMACAVGALTALTWLLL